MARPKGSTGHKTIAHQVAFETHRIREDGREREATTLDMVLIMLRNEMLAGNQRCLKFIDDLDRRLRPAPPDVQYGYLIAPKPMSEEEWRARTEKHQAKYRTLPYAGDPELSTPNKV